MNRGKMQDLGIKRPGRGPLSPVFIFSWKGDISYYGMKECVSKVRGQASVTEHPKGRISERGEKTTRRAGRESHATPLVIRSTNSRKVDKQAILPTGTAMNVREKGKKIKERGGLDSNTRLTSTPADQVKIW